MLLMRYGVKCAAAMRPVSKLDGECTVAYMVACSRSRAV